MKNFRIGDFSVISGFLIAVTLLSCSKGDKINIHNSYTVVVEYVDKSGNRKVKSAEHRMDSNRLYIFFEQQFDSDTMVVRFNGNNSEQLLYLTTSENLGVADGLEYLNIDSIKTVELKMNNGKSLIFEIKEKWMNKWAVNFYNDTLKASVLNYAPIYE